MISSNFLGELAGALRNAGVSATSIDITIGILSDIFQLDPNKNVRRALDDWLGNQRQRQFPSARSAINFIPSDLQGDCHDLLMTVCPREDDFDHNTMETIALCINCHLKMKAVIIVSGWWSEEDFNEWRKSSFKALHDQFGITFVIITPHAGAWTFNPIVF